MKTFAKNTNYSLLSVTILYNDPSHGDNAFKESASGVLVEVDAVTAACAELKMPCRAISIKTLNDIPALFTDDNSSVVINLVEELLDDGANYIPILCTAFGKKFTGNPSIALMASFDKRLAKGVLAGNSIPTPSGIVITQETDKSHIHLAKGTFIVKPVKADASEGIFPDSVVSGEGEALAEKIIALAKRHQCTMLVEQYIAGREINVSILEINGVPTILPIAEILFLNFPDGKPHIVDYTAKWIPDSFESKNTMRSVPATLDDNATAAIKEYALQSWNALECKGYARVDMRLADDGKVYVIEVNPNPDISPDAGFIAAAAAGGLSYSDVIGHIITAAAGPDEQSHNTIAKELISGEKTPFENSAIEIHRSLLREREDICAIVTATKFFNAEELDIVKELFDDAMQHGPKGHYQAYTALLNGEVIGWACFGQVPATASTYDIYWIIINPSRQGKKLGSTLLAFIEKVIAEAGGTITVIETSSNALYMPTRSFYEKRGYRLSANLKDYYFPGSGKIIYLKRL